MKIAAVQIDVDPLVLNSASVNLAGLRDTLGVIALTDGDTSRHMEIIIVVIVEQTVFDQRRHDLVEFATAKTEGQ